jgi:hypothetical protein
VQGKYEILMDEAGGKFIKNDSLYQVMNAQGIADRKVLRAMPLSEFVSDIRELLRK